MSEEAACESRWLAAEDLGQLIQTLRARGYCVVGPTIRQGAVVYDEILSPEDLPRGWTDSQEAGRYRLEHRGDERYFGFNVGPHSWKQFLFPPSAVVATARQTEQGWELQAATGENSPRYAFLGVRACELAAIAVQDRVFLEGGYVDPLYRARRQNALIIAVNCTASAPTCFCHSMGTGPRCVKGFDLALTESDAGFVLEAGSDRGRELLADLPTREASLAEVESVAQGVAAAASAQVRRLPPTSEVRELLLGNPRHPHWSTVAERCLSCANCTQVCPTCFCSSVTEVTDLDATRSDRTRTWDSCFNFDFSYMNGGVVRNSIRSRYRQWLTHKLASWVDQFGSSGCVGCGRCITWCPVAIDLTAEVAALAASPTVAPVKPEASP